VSPRETETLLEVYDQLSQVTGSMLSAARAADWDRLISLEQDCSALVARLSSLERDAPLPEPLRSRKASLIRKVLGDDAAIRDITEPWLAQLGEMLGTHRRSRRLLDSYGPPRAT
jgi:flagellar protein FliT